MPLCRGEAFASDGVSSFPHSGRANASPLRVGSAKDLAVSLAGRSLSRLVRPGPPSATPPRAILVLKPCCLGDVLMATPAVAALRQAFPDARLDFAVGGWSTPALAGNPRLDRLVDCGLVGSGRRYPLGQYRQLVAKVRQGGYDWCFTLERSAVVGMVPWLAGVPHRIGIDSAGRGFAHTVRVPLQQGRHEAETYLDLVRTVGVPAINPRLEFFPSEAEHQRAAGLLPGPGPWLAVHPGGGTNPGMTLGAKRWPAARFAQVARLAIAQGLGVVLVGAEYDMSLAAEVQAAAGSVPAGAMLSLAGRTTLGELAAVLGRCAAFLGNDTGAMHLAVAVGTPPVALFGPTDARMYGPYRLGESLSAGLDCAPCFVDGRIPRCPAPRCMEAISVGQVWEALQRVLAGAAERSADTGSAGRGATK